MFFIIWTQASLEQHQESEKHVQNESCQKVVHIVFADPDPEVSIFHLLMSYNLRWPISCTFLA
jgi:hypothetical protein